MEEQPRKLMMQDGCNDCFEAQVSNLPGNRTESSVRSGMFIDNLTKKGIQAP